MGGKRAQTGEVGGFGNLFQISQGLPIHQIAAHRFRAVLPGIKPLDQLLKALILPVDLACE